MSKRTSKLVISSRLLVLQSKRLVLSSMERRQSSCGRQVTPDLVAEAHRAALRARDAYRSVVLRFESPDCADYWLVAYDTLLETGGNLRARLHQAASELPAVERYQAAADAEVLEGMLARWTESIRQTMAEAVA